MSGAIPVCLHGVYKVDFTSTEHCHQPVHTPHSCTRGCAQLTVYRSGECLGGRGSYFASNRFYISLTIF
jgi:hypothetical protein